MLFCRNFPKLFDHNQSETKSEAKSEPGQTDNKTQTLPEQEPLVVSQENLAFEEDDKHLEPKDTSTDSTSTLETTVESMESERGSDAKEVERKGNDSGISVSHVNGSDVTSTEEETTASEDDHDHEMQPVLKQIGTFAMKFMDARPPEIKVDKPQTLSSVAKGDSKDAPPEKPPQSPRRHTDRNIKNKILQKSTLLPEEAALIKRRHSDFAVSAPRPINEELAIEDMKKRGSQGAGMLLLCKYISHYYRLGHRIMEFLRFDWISNHGI